MICFYWNLQNVQFENCKMTWVNFSQLGRLSHSIIFIQSILNYASFVHFKIKETKFLSCNLVEADFSQAEIEAAIFDNCNLELAVFDVTNLERTDFSTSYNFQIIPENNRLKKTIFSKDNLEGLVAHLNIVVKWESFKYFLGTL